MPRLKPSSPQSPCGHIVRPHPPIGWRLLEKQHQALLLFFLLLPALSLLSLGGRPSYLVLAECLFWVSIGTFVSCVSSSPSACFLLPGERGPGSYWPFWLFSPPWTRLSMQISFYHGIESLHFCHSSPMTSFWWTFGQSFNKYLWRAYIVSGQHCSRRWGHSSVQNKAPALMEPHSGGADGRKHKWCSRVIGASRVERGEGMKNDGGGGAWRLLRKGDAWAETGQEWGSKGAMRLSREEHVSRGKFCRMGISWEGGLTPF